MDIFFVRLRALLKEKNWTQTDLSKQAGIAETTISRWGADPETVPSRTSLNKIIAATGCALKWLRDGEGEMFPEAGGPSQEQGNVKMSNSSISQHKSTFGYYRSGGAGNHAIEQGRVTPQNDLSGDDEFDELMALVKDYESPAGIRMMLKKYRKIKAELDE